MTWPLIQRNKVEDSKVSVPVQACSENENTVIADLAKKVRFSLHYATRLFTIYRLAPRTMVSS